MGKTTEIGWTDHTANFWWGCFKVSDGCKHCYAETFSKRVGQDIWGPPATTDRSLKKAVWTDLFKWDKDAQKDNVRRRVFVQSMSDFFEDHPQVIPWRERAFKILEQLQWLDVQLLTKRPENILRMAPPHWLDNWPAHIWAGTSVEDQKNADERIPHLMAIPSKVRFLSCEPLLGPVDLWGARYDQPDGSRLGAISGWADYAINWVIVGGESGPHRRPMDLQWARDIQRDCKAAGTAFFMKQWDKVKEIPADLMVREFPLSRSIDVLV